MAEDRGLYVPAEIPALPFKPGDMTGAKYKDIATKIIGAFFDDYTDEEIKYCIDGAYTDKFEAEDVVPVAHAGGADFLELYHGRTAAFKDMALSILPYLLTTALKKENEDKKICILTATSGDTGKAALEGFADVPGTEIIVFFPNKGVSAVQERQMVSQKGENVHVFAVNGNFDDAQTGVKNIFEDDAIAAELADRGVRLSSANSINIGRLVPQVAYYVYGYVKLIEKGIISDGDPINIVVPTGNFGNILAAYYASLMGIPVGKFICASNKNKVLTDFIATGTYDKNREFYLTNSPSMDILISSNLERLLYHLAGGDADEVLALMKALDSEGKYTVSGKIKEGLECFWGGFADVEQTNAAIGKMYEENGYLMDTHTAVAYKVYEQYREETGDNTPALIASTASPYKFAGSVTSSLGMEASEDEFAAVRALEEKTGVKVPSCLKDLDKAPVRHGDVIDIDAMPGAVKGSL
jgi:threonine synthase